MPCVPVPLRLPSSGRHADLFAFSPAEDGISRGFANAALLLSMPWMAFWAVTLESLNPENYRRR